jgi:hypothetical protein
MEFQKIQLTKQNTLNVTYKNGDGDVVQVTGANIVHKDLKDALNALIPHLSIICEQREAYGRTLKEIQKDRITDEGDGSVFKRFTCDTISLSNDEQEVSFSGQRILLRAGVITLATPKIDLGNSDDYEYSDDLAVDIDAVKYEAKLYLEDKKWGVKEGDLDFRDIDPFNGVEAQEVSITVEANIGEQPKKRGRKSKKAA